MKSTKGWDSLADSVYLKKKMLYLILFLFLLVMLLVGVCCAVMSVPCSLVVTCRERADLLAIVFVVFCRFP